MDSRRRGVSTRPTSEEVECWTHASESLRSYSKHTQNHPSYDLLGRANRLFTTWPKDDDLPGEGWKSLKENHKKLTIALEEIQKHADTEVRLLDECIEQVGILMALRKAPEATPSDKRNKRPRASSPAGTPGPAASQNNSRGVSITLPPRTSSVGPSVQTKKRDPRTQHPLQEGRKVAFWNGNTNPASGEGGDWILALVVRLVGSEKGKYIYEVRDAEEQDNAGAIRAPQRCVIPLPDPKTPISPEFAVGSTVLGLYPDTSCFYRAEVIATPKQLSGGNQSIRQAVYKLKFEDDDNQEHTVPAEWVVDYPGPH